MKSASSAGYLGVLASVSDAPSESWNHLPKTRDGIPARTCEEARRLAVGVGSSGNVVEHLGMRILDQLAIINNLLT